MLKYLEIFDKKFISDNNYNLLSFRGNLTDNVIIKCKTYDVVDYIATIILETVNNVETSNIEENIHTHFCCGDEDIDNARVDIIDLGLEEIIIKINKQTIIISTRPEIILKVKNKKDLWFISEAEDGLRIYGLVDFESYDGELDTSTLQDIINGVSKGRFGDIN